MSVPFEEDFHDDIVYPATVPFVLFHVACLGVFWTGVSAATLAGAAILYVVRMWAVTAGYHRYFSHRSYRTSRAFQFFLAFLGQTSGQRGVVWWAAIHRHHHLHSDTPEDIHSPRHMGFFHSHVGWIFRPRRFHADYETVSDLTRFPELMWLDRQPYLPVTLLGIAVFLVGGWQALFVSFVLGTVVLYHCVFFINSLAHVMGSQRYITGDDSRNNWWLAIITLGEGWHNNHHFYQSATAQGWRWYEIDISYYALKALSWVGLVWDLRAPPEKVVQGAQPLGRKVIEKVAHQLAWSFPVDGIAAQVRDAWDDLPSLGEIRARLRAAVAERTAGQGEDLVRRIREARVDLAQWLDSATRPHVPTVEDLRDRAREMFADTPSVDDIARRAREILLHAVESRIIEEALEGA
jgi:stearoyl-CoA desaturase (delta-9 desaturase)